MPTTNNRSLRQTLLDIEQARAQYRILRADRLPGFSAGASGNRQRLPADLFRALGGVWDGEGLDPVVRASR